jgi:membrane protein implicated in regulation of membrane protease activity
MDRTTRIGVMLLGGLGAAALVVMVLVLFLGLKLWMGLVLLAVLDIAELVWAYDALIRKRRRPAS